MQIVIFTESTFKSVLFVGSTIPGRGAPLPTWPPGRVVERCYARALPGWQGDEDRKGTNCIITFFPNLSTFTFITFAAAPISALTPFVRNQQFWDVKHVKFLKVYFPGGLGTHEARYPLRRCREDFVWSCGVYGAGPAGAAAARKAT